VARDSRSVWRQLTRAGKATSITSVH
jgi:hypothetical protein